MARQGIITGTLALAAVTGLFAGLSGLVIDSETGDMLMQLMTHLPPAMLSAFNFDIDSLQSFSGWMASEPYTFYALILGMMLTIRATGIVAREMDHNTAEAIVSLPVRRRSLFLSKAVAQLLVATIAAGAATGAALLAGHFAVGIDDATKIVTLFGAGYLTALAFAGIGFGLSPLIDGERSATSISTALVLGSFVIEILSTLSDKLTWISRASLFSLFDVNAVVATASLPLGPTVAAFLLLGTGLAVGAHLFERKDISV